MIIHRLHLPLIFPAGLSAGEFTDGNQMLIARDGSGRAVLRGTALAGAMRHAWKDQCADLDVSAVFGSDQGSPDMQASRLEVSECVLNGSAANATATQRTHNLVNRHNGVVVDGALFCLEATGPNTTADAVLWLRDDGQIQNIARAVDVIASMFATGLLLGGRSNRGVGFAKLRAEATRCLYDLSDLDQHAAYLDDHRAMRLNQIADMTPGKPITATLPVDSSVLNITLRLKIPRGQDLLIGAADKTVDGAQPQEVIDSSGNHFWRLPGSSLRGVLRAWMTRLAARQGKTVADSLQRHQNRKQPAPADELARAFVTDEQLKNGETPDCVIANLFGYLGKRGRLHIADSFIPVSPDRLQHRKHVAIDRVTGGSNEGALFANDLIVSGVTENAFEVQMQLKNPTENDVRWLADTLRAIDVGVLRLGSSKASGRLCLAESPAAVGPFAEQFTSIKPYQSPFVTRN